MTHRTTWAILVVFALLGGALWLALRGTSKPEAPSTQREQTSASEADTLTTTRPADLPTTSAASLAREVVPGAPTFVLRGRVFSDPRTPLTGARVLVHAAEPGDEEPTYASLMRDAGGATSRPRRARGKPADTPQLAEAQLAADGTFTIANLTRRHLRVRLDHTHHALEKACYVHAAADTNLVDVGTLRTRLGAHVLGHVEPRTTLAAEVTLTAEIDPLEISRSPGSMRSMLSGESEPRARCAADGSFELRAVPATPAARLFLAAPDVQATTNPFPLAAGETHEVVVRAARSVELAVSVHDEKGAPVAEARVEARRRDLTGQNARLRGSRRGTTDATGRCTLRGLAPELTLVTVSAEGFVSGEAEVVPGAGTSSEVAVALARGLTVSGIVVDAHDAPIEGAHVAAVPSVDVPFVGDLIDMGSSGFTGPAAEGSKLVTDQAGHFTLSGLEKDASITVAVAKPGWLAGGKSKVKVGTSDVRVVLKRGGTVVGKLAAATLTDARVETVVTFAVVMKRPTATTTANASAGTFTLTGVQPGAATLKVTCAGFADYEREIAVVDEETLDVGTLELAQAARITGRVVDPEGRGVAAATVTRKRGGMADNPMLAAMLGGESATSGSDGSFVLGNLAPGGVTLTATVDGFAPGQSKRVELAAGQRLDGVEIRLAHGGRIVGMLKLPAGERAADFQVMATRSGATSFAGTRAEASGRFELTNLEPGRYELQAIDQAAMGRLTSDAQDSMRPGKSIDFGKIVSALGERTLHANCTVRDGQTAEVELDGSGLSATGTLVVGEVLVGDTPLAEGMLELTKLGETEGGNLRMVGIRDGRFEARGIAPGTWSLQARLGMTMAPTGEATRIEVGKDQEKLAVKLRLPAGAVRGRVLEESSGTPLPGALVRLMRPKGSSRDFEEHGFALTDARGEFSLEGLAEGTYDLVADDRMLTTSNEAHAGRLENVELAAGQKLTGLVLRARASASVIAKITAASGAPGAHAICAVVDREGRPLGSHGIGVADVNGVAHFAGLAGGEAFVIGRVEGEAPVCSDLVTLVAGKEATATLFSRSGVRTSLRVEDQNGARLSNASVALRKDGSPWVPHLLLVQGTDATQGLDLGELPAGPIEVRVEHPSLGVLVAKRTIPASASAHLVISR